MAGQQILLAFWKRLSLVNQLTFQARTHSQHADGWNGQGAGSVSITREGACALIFNEKGSWQNKRREVFNFSNAFRWTLDQQGEMISLEHLRKGRDRPVFLFHLVPSGRASLVSVKAHLCAEDKYEGYFYLGNHNLCLSWRVIGPKKNEEMDYFYS
ncbi:DUF6314 family protein [Candidatus Protochlamydia phocaeensis]|uniref:DUF6314 family protein n=1 Tax=Candidatus Protochlamydia phocaeensis TaxID=1414722 RepID=UPI000837E790|nr:DUF6314 family protein [Candidatus Protochlamydia phocaeensis]